MEPEQVRSSATPATSRRELHRAGDAARRQRSTRSARSTTALGRWAPRGAVLAALAAATIAFPVADATFTTQDAPEGVTPVAAAVGLPTAYEVLSSTTVGTTPTTLLAAAPGRAVLADVASRSVEREPLPGCDGLARTDGANGQIASSDLCVLWDPAQSLRGDAAVALSELNANYRAAFRRDLCITDSYRPLAVQRRLAVTKPGLAATPGRSNHGWGLAIDLCATETNSSDVMAWLRANGPTYGWDNPQWARRGGSGPYEPWHWEYVPGTTALGTNWD
ncbi:M15 family metallopeptidase [Cellulomonas carbonis]|uniref:M15 family metallopeptidase n=1 Tax=Cellulomonas carbonis TaxID=1386092 RepID=UPI0006935D96|nr:M15 family metallopeptidase [Cellulomonas carbonis]GGC11838.1 hypothetical protein GCM10010972_26420 [Cellulomonas carbonis]